MVSLPLGLQFQFPPTRFTSLEALPGNPYPQGFYLLDRPRLGISCDAFGVAWTIGLVPSGVGETVAAVTTFSEWLVQVNVVMIDITGRTLNRTVVNIDVDEGQLMFPEFPVERIAVWVKPATSVNLSWVLVL